MARASLPSASRMRAATSMPTRPSTAPSIGSTSRRRASPVAIELLADAVMNSTLPPDEYVKEQEVIRREFAMGNDDPDRVSGQAALCDGLSRASYRHPVIGHLDVFNAPTRDEVMAYYKARYVPNNMFFVVVGDVDAERVRAQISRVVCARIRGVALPCFSFRQSRRRLAGAIPTRSSPRNSRGSHLAWHVPPLTHPDIPALDVLAMVLGGGRSSRLYRRLREELALVHSIDAWCYAPGQAGLFGVDAMLDPGKRAQVEAEVLRMLGELRDSGVTRGANSTRRAKAFAQPPAQPLTTMRGRLPTSAQTGCSPATSIFPATISPPPACHRERFAPRHRDVSHRSQSHRRSLNPARKPRGGSRADVTRLRVGEIQKFELPNGLRLLVREDARLPLVSIAASFKARPARRNSGEQRHHAAAFASSCIKGTPHRRTSPTRSRPSAAASHRRREQ